MRGRREVEEEDGSSGAALGGRAASPFTGLFFNSDQHVCPQLASAESRSCDTSEPVLSRNRFTCTFLATNLNSNHRPSSGISRRIGADLDQQVAGKSGERIAREKPAVGNVGRGTRRGAAECEGDATAGLLG